MAVKDHPRRCGENHTISYHFKPPLGSPPQVRGKLSVFRNKHFRHRITPAGAGKTRIITHSLYPLQDHPRRCGENTVALAGEIVTVGSPPQVRGKLTAKPKVAVDTEDHPRRCGENPTHSNIFYRNQGSPPQVRGKRVVYSADKAIYGITPAGAGKTFFCGITALAEQDHPRRCGENFQSSDSEESRPGSPPQVRGKH